jgi:4-diphosphocytidyl-2-C-methyl-D-erythritol kinase
MQKILLKAYGKINLTLDVLEKRPDGYHEIETLFRGIHLYDIVSLERQAWGIQLECSEKSLEGPDNLAFQAASLLQRDFPQIQGVTIRLFKRIPIAAGLAGGSADAAAVLIGMNRLFKLNLSRQQLHHYAAQLGADIPFCLYPLSAIGRGKGEELTPVPEGPPIWLVLVKPPFGLFTQEVYEHLSKVDIPARPDLSGVLEGLERQDYPKIFQNLGNVLAYSAFELQPKLQEWQQELAQKAEQVMMTGSGPTLVAFFSNEEAARKLAALWTQPRWEVLLSRTLSKEELESRMVFYKSIEDSEE